MRVRLRLGGVAAMLVLACVQPPPAAAFWPFTREVKPTADEEAAAAAKLDERFRDWQAGKSPQPAAATGSVAGAGPDSLANAAGASGNQGPITTMGSKPEPGLKLPPQGSGPTMPSTAGTGPSAVPPDSLARAAAAADSLARLASAGGGAPADSLAGLARSDSTAGNPAAPNQQPPPGAPMTPAVAAAMLQKGWAPDLNSKLSTTNDFVRASTDLTTAFADPTGITLNSTLSYADDISSTQRSETQNRAFTNGINFPFTKQGLTISVSTTNRRMDQASRTISNASTSNKTEDKGADASVLASRRLTAMPGLDHWRNALRGLGVNAFYARRFNQNAQNIVAVQGSGAGERQHSGQGSSYGAGVSFQRLKWLDLRARLGTTHINNLDRSPTLPNGEQTSTSSGDTATVDVSIPTFWHATGTTFSYRVANGNDSYTDAVVNQSGSQTGSIGNFALETKRSYSRSLNFATHVRLRALDLGVTLNAGEDSTDYALKKTNFTDTRRYGGKIESKLGWHGTTFTANLEMNLSDVNQDRNNEEHDPLTRKDYANKLYLELQRPLTKTMSVRLYGDTGLNSGVYKYDSPGGKADRDELRQRIACDFNGSIGPNVTATVTAYVTRYDQAFIDPRTSANSRNETEYVIRNGYTWQFNKRISIGQNFGLASKVAEKVFNREDRTLNRNHFMNTHMDAKINDRWSMNARYDYLLQDNGNYIQPLGSKENFFTPTVRTKKDGIGVGMRYDVIGGGKLTFVSIQESTREHTTRFDGRPVGITNRGNLGLGFESKLETQALKLDCRVQRNQNFNIAINRPVYYNVDATLSYTF